MKRTRLFLTALIIGSWIFLLQPATADETTSGLTLDVYTYDPTNLPEAKPYELCADSWVSVDQINHDWGGDIVAGCAGDFVLLHYSGFITLPESGEIVFQSMADDGFVMSIGGQIVIDNWSPKGCSGGTGTHDFEANVSQSIDVWFYEYSGGACNILYYYGVDGFNVVPSDAFTTLPVIVPVVTPEPSQSSSPTPEPTATPTLEPTPEATQTPEPSATPTTEPEPTPTPEPSESAYVPVLEPTPTPLPTPVDEPTPAVEPQPTPEVTPTQQPQEQLPEPVVETTPTPEPTIEPLQPPLEPTLEPTADEVTQAVIDDALADGVLTDTERELVADALLEEFAGEAITFEALQEAGLDYEDLPPTTPVTLENGVVLTADVADALEIFDSGAEVLATILENPAKALKALVSIGADMTEEDRETAQNTVVAAVVVTQVAQVRKMK
jgi:hypothetical protein